MRKEIEVDRIKGTKVFSPCSDFFSLICFIVLVGIHLIVLKVGAIRAFVSKKSGVKLHNSKNEGKLTI